VADADTGEAGLQAVPAGTTGTGGYGTWAVTTTGIWTYLLDNANAAVQALNTGDTLFDRLDVPAARYNSIDDLLTDPHLDDVGFFRTEEHPSEGRIRRTKLANTFSGGAREDETHAPRTGEHTREVLAEAGYSAPEIDALLTCSGFSFEG